VSQPHHIWLQDCATGRSVEALLYERIDPVYAERVDDAWLIHLATAEAQAKARGEKFEAPEHAHWRWHEKVLRSSHLLSCPTLAVECEGQPQGLMLLKTDGHFARHSEQSEKPLVFITYLSTAPWNMPSVAPRPRFRGVGTNLLRAAVEVSLDLEFKGRVGLHSLPNAEPFYERQGMQCLGQDSMLNYYEFSPENAAAFIR
jgi:GNAT superfamily N-acetyltransferase